MEVLIAELADLIMVSIWIGTVGFFLSITVAIIGFRLMRQDAEKINAVQAAIFLQMRQQFADFDSKMTELLRRQS